MEMKIKKITYDHTRNLKNLVDRNVIGFHKHTMNLNDSGLLNALESIDSLQDKNKRLQDSIRSLKDRITHLEDEEDLDEQENGEEDESELEENYKDLSNKYDIILQDKESLEEQLRNQSEELDRIRNIKKSFYKWGKYLSLMKDLDILLYFMEHKDRAVKLEELIDEFQDTMAGITVSHHIRSLCERGFIRHGKYRGQYILSDHGSSQLEEDMYQLCKNIVGSEIFSLALQYYNKK